MISTTAQDREFERIARNYTNRMKNDAKKRYAARYAQALLAANLNDDDVPAIERGTLSLMAAQAVEMNLREFARMAMR